jgi:DNA-binding GntR family transcriptional regulator
MPARTEPGLPSAAEVLADRIAAAVVAHDAGWQLPRHTALARRYNVSTEAIDVAIGKLMARHLVCRLPDGRAYRASPADYFIPLAGVPSLGALVDPMGSDITCHGRRVSWRRAPEDIGRALGIAHRQPVCVLRLLWKVNGEPAALSTTYLAGNLAAEVTASKDAAREAAALNLLPLNPAPAEHEREETPRRQTCPLALVVEMQPPPPSMARSLRLAPGQMAATVIVRFGDPSIGTPAAITITVLRPDQFRIVVEVPAQPLPASAMPASHMPRHDAPNRDL